jgi:formiminotetrahydrofolate cyclodeaminase
LEYRIRAAQKERGASSPANFLDNLAAGTPTPGGGSAAAYSGAMAAGLVAMVAQLSMGKKKYQDIETEMGDVLKKVEALRAQLTNAVQEDSAAYEGVMEAFRLPKKTEEEKDARSQAIQEATLNAAQVPLETARLAVEVLELAVVLAEKGNPNAITDAGTAAGLAQAAISGAGMNVRINLSSLKDAKAINKVTDKLEKLESKTEALIDNIKQAVTKRGEIPML